MKLIITSSIRSGSRWLLELLSDSLNMKTEPEINSEERFYFEKEHIIKSLNNNTIVKLHGVQPLFIFDHLDKDSQLKIIGVVRNPRDRAVSYAFHYKYHEWEVYNPLPHLSDFDAVKYVVLDDVVFNERNWHQFYLMKEGYSTKNKILFDFPYIWTSYKWLKEDTFGELSKILEFIGSGTKITTIQEAVKKNQFTKKSGRKEGVEDRSDMWRRKAIMDDWKNWFNEKMVKATDNIQEKYNLILEREENAGSRLS